MPRHKRDWKQYNKQLINRGNLNFWVTKKSLKFWRAKSSRACSYGRVSSDLIFSRKKWRTRRLAEVMLL
ncbi:MAG: hypothetical protein K940chlam2_00261 [Chlamydiae bacterium]|nr:hypothetical protein [Chlamydiota bacterium]